MKYFLAIILILTCFACRSKTEQFTSGNPLSVEFGDPYILKASDGFYYMVGTGGVKNGFKMYSSTDLKSWKDEGRIYQGNSGRMRPTI